MRQRACGVAVCLSRQEICFVGYTRRSPLGEAERLPFPRVDLVGDCVAEGLDLVGCGAGDGCCGEGGEGRGLVEGWGDGEEV
jgi:hypothetical protein